MIQNINKRFRYKSDGKRRDKWRFMSTTISKGSNMGYIKALISGQGIK